MTSDTELIRNEHSCGQIALSDGVNQDISNKELNSDSKYRLYACIDICKGSHGCNTSSKSIVLSYYMFILCWSVNFFIIAKRYTNVK